MGIFSKYGGKMSELRDLKLKQLSDGVKEGKIVSADKIGKRIQDIREALGMTQKQLAKKLKTTQSSLSKIEEDAGSTTIKTLVRIVNGLQCELKIAVVSSDRLEDVVRRQAEKKAKEMLNRTFSHMALEQQAPTSSAYQFQLNKLIEELVSKPGPSLWEE